VPEHTVDAVVTAVTDGEPPPNAIATLPLAVQPSVPVAFKVYVSVAFTVATGFVIVVELNEFVLSVNVQAYEIVGGVNVNFVPEVK
jgi:hypothetical protein